MAASLTHLVCGERVFHQINALEQNEEVYASFLAGCTLVDVHAFHDIERTATHFAGHLGNAEAYEAGKSCELFLRELKNILKRPWSELDGREQAFVAGYLCHLAADECWKELGKKMFRHLDISRWTELPVHPDVILTAFDYLCRKELRHPVEAGDALDVVRIPDVFTHVSHEVFNSQWRILRDYLAADGTPAAYQAMLARSGKFDDNARARFEQRFALWEEALELVDNLGGVAPLLDCAENRSLEVIPLLWGRGG